MKNRRMASKLITCPESAHLENIEYEDHPLGMLIVACTRFNPSCEVTCGRLCAARLDRKQRAAFEEEPTNPGEMSPACALDAAFESGEDAEVEISIELADLSIG